MKSDHWRESFYGACVTISFILVFSLISYFSATFQECINVTNKWVDYESNELNIATNKGQFTTESIEIYNTLTINEGYLVSVGKGSRNIRSIKGSILK